MSKLFNMFWLLCFIICCGSSFAQSGTITLQGILSGGGDIEDGKSSLSYSIGLPVFQFHSNEGQGSFSQGFQHGFSLVTSLKRIDLEGLNVVIYPNPVDGILNIKIMGAENLPNNIGYNLYDVNGALLMGSPIHSREVTVDLSILPSAVYFLQFTTRRGHGEFFKIFKI